MAELGNNSPPWSVGAETYVSMSIMSLDTQLYKSSANAISLAGFAAAGKNTRGVVSEGIEHDSRGHNDQASSRLPAAERLSRQSIGGTRDTPPRLLACRTEQRQASFFPRCAGTNQ